MDRQPDSRARFVLARWVFLRGLAVVFGLAFVSLWVQIHGLIGGDGILPAVEWLEAVRRHFGGAEWLRVPTLCWFSATDLSLHAQCAAGVVLSLLLLAGLAPRLVLALLWVLYLSLCTVGQEFLSYQWDVLLLETAVFAILFSPGTWLVGVARERGSSRAALFLVRFLLFRLMLASGLVKLASGDASWTDGTALTFHYFTQPIPSPASWYAQHLPRWIQGASCWLMFAIEIGLPFLCFGPRFARLVAFVGFVFLQVLIAATGNYGFFNLLTVVLCVPLVDDAIWARVLPRKLVESAALVRPSEPGCCARVAMAGLIVVVIALGIAVNVRRIVRGFSVPEPLATLEEWIEPARSFNAYGLFAVMTKERPEIAIEVSDDGVAWREVAFRYKAGDVQCAPPHVAPHMPRLDWQFWFAALSPQRYAAIVQRTCGRVLEGSPRVLALLQPEQFPDGPPRWLRATMWDYRFTTPEERAAGQGWWSRKLVRELIPPVQPRQATPFRR